ncbi:MAG: mechanosensitive ion channel family protein [Calditrichaeota bacterium]|nr:mechanosensitive ion channel family protein [Calditrichota bacterium]RQW01759.1 MAG: mechanosensitive ion channel family protein [Calditrichota bacterium]
MFDIVFYNNTLQQWAIGIGAAVVTFILLRIIKGLLHRRISKMAQKSNTDIDDLVAELIRKIHFLLLLMISLFVGTYFLTLSDKILDIFQVLIILALLLQGGIWGTTVIQWWVNRYKKERMTEDAASVTTFSALGLVLKIVVWSIVLLLALDNLGINITALVAGLGVGGIAVALAVQNILGDLFASLSIVLDKPFVIGDFIIIDNYLGSVEHIGLKTTRIRSLGGEQLIFSNSDLLNSRIRNYKRMFERRVVFALGVIYQTPAEKLKKIPGIIRQIIESQENVRFDRAHFKDYGDFSLNFEIVYWVKSPDYNVYMDIQQAINLEIFRQFKENEIEFAYPTQLIYTAKENGE